MPAAEKATRLAEEHGYKDRVSLHLNLSEGTPMTDGIRKTALCRQGKLLWASEKRFLACMSPSAIRAIRAECEAQMRRFRELGFTSAHLDSHDWVLYNEAVLLAIKPLLKKYGFETTRVGCENWIRGSKPPLKMYRRFMSAQIAKVLRSEENWAGGLDSLRRFAAAGEIGPDTRAEIMTHPDMIDGIPCDSLHGKHVPMSELTDAVASYGTIFNR